MLLELKRWVVPPGHQVLLQDVSWSELEQILEELGEHRAARISYSSGVLEIMTPLPEHEDDKVIISDFVKILLEELGQEFRNLGSTTFKHEQMDQAVEPDECFYIQHETAIRGKKRIDLTVDPPPDLAIEIDITARTRFNNYEKLGVPELWRYNGTVLEIYVLKQGKYVLSDQSLQFSQFTVQQSIPKYLEQSKVQGRTAAMKAFRHWVMQQL
ncbi:MAG: Uma2 family endonuclease [Leptolyngbyaceae cyanobacterium RM1_406_9]|nr:Uma2 family endonuclease [Leptolyngbyaceae cyanobacterium RM1_406_9]